jgi:hypothetical protein
MLPKSDWKLISIDSILCKMSVHLKTHKEAAFNNHLNNDHTIFPNKVFDTVLKIQLPHHPTT